MDPKTAPLSQDNPDTAQPCKPQHAPPPAPNNLIEARDDLSNVLDHAKERDFDAPSQIAIENAGRMLESVYEIAPLPYTVYAIPDGYVAIDGSVETGNYVTILCGSGGDVSCLANIDGEKRRASYETARNLPDSFIREALQSL